MTYSAKVVFLVNRILLGVLTYQKVIKAKPEFQVSIDAYIEEKQLVIDKAV